MSNITLLKIWQRLRQAEGSPFPEMPNVQNRHLMLKGSFPVSTNAGFTLIEMIVVVIIIAVLSAIAAPGWLAFTNRQRVSKVNDAVLSAIQKAQQEAKSKKVSYSVSFYTPSDGLPQVAIYPANTSPNWQNLAENLDIKSSQVILGTNLVSTSNVEPYISTKVSSVDYSKGAAPTNPTQKLTFDYRGTLPIGSHTDLAIVVAVPKSNSSIQPIPDTKRCVIVKTLLGSLQIKQGTDCPEN